MAKKKDKLSDNAAVQIHGIHAKADAFARVLSDLIRWGSLVSIAYLFAPVATAMAGKETTANFSLSLMANEHFAAVFGIIFGVSGIAYGRFQATLRRDVIERLHPYQLKHEKEIDPGRSSSELTPRGETAKGER